MPYRLQRDHAYTWVLAASPIPTGLVIALFNGRFTARSWRFAGGIPGGYPGWAGVLLICGVASLACLFGHRGMRREAILVGAMILSGMWWFCLGGLFLITAIIDPLANPLGAVAWWIICAFYWIWSAYEVQNWRLL